MIFKMMESLLVVSGFVNKTYVTRGKNICRQWHYSFYYFL
jgi:hypothetical protein